MRNLTRYIGYSVMLMVLFLLLTVGSSIAAPQIVVMASRQPGAEPFWKDIALLLSSAATAVIGLAALFFSARNVNKQVASSDSNANAQRWRDANQIEIEQLEEVLRTFHMPYLVRAEANNNMAQDLRDRLRDPQYRLLTKLLDPTWLNTLSAGDRALVDEVCRAGLKLRIFIEEHGGVVDSKLAGHLARASTHFRILSLAHAGKLGTDPTPFARYVYPRQLDLAIEADRNRILKRLALLRAHPSDDHGIIEPLDLPEEARLEPWPDPIRQSQDTK